MKLPDYPASQSPTKSQQRKRMGATTPQEQMFCEWYAREIYTGRAAIVELGPWMGSLTLSMAEGFAARKKTLPPAPPIHSYDRFIWEAIMEGWVAGTKWEKHHQPGDSFRDSFIAELGEAKKYVYAIAADLETQPWTGEPIEFLLNDAWKTIRIANNVINQFLPCLIPGKSLVAHQDYLWNTDSFIQIAMYRLREYFRLEYVVPGSCMAVFRCIRKIPSGKGDLPPAFSDFSLEEIDAAYAWSADQTDVALRPLIENGKAYCLMMGGRGEAAIDVTFAQNHNPHAYSSLFQFQRQVLHEIGLTDAFRLKNLPFLLNDPAFRKRCFDTQNNVIWYWTPMTGRLWTNPELFPLFTNIEDQRKFTLTNTTFIQDFINS